LFTSPHETGQLSYARGALCESTATASVRREQPMAVEHIRREPVVVAGPRDPAGPRKRPTLEWNTAIVSCLRR